MLLVRNTAPLSSVLHHEIRVPVEELPDIDAGASLLDIGSGKADGALLSTLQSQADIGQVVRLDYFRSNLAANPAREPKVAANATELPFKDGSFDVVLTSEITNDNPYFNEFHPDPVCMIAAARNRDRMGREIARVLKLEGVWIAYHEIFSPRPIPGLFPTVERLTRGVDSAGMSVTGLVIGTYYRIKE